MPSLASLPSQGAATGAAAMSGERQRELGERMQRALASLVYLPHLQAAHDGAEAAAAPGAGGAPSPGAASAAGRGRPWDRSDLFRRLATFKASTWFCKPEPIGPVACARRGWTNTGPDLLTCEVRRSRPGPPAALLPPALLLASPRLCRSWAVCTPAHGHARWRQLAPTSLLPRPCLPRPFPPPSSARPS